LSSFLSQFLAKDKLLGIFILKLNDSLRSEVVLFTNSELLLLDCCIAGGRGNSFNNISLLFSSVVVFSIVDVSVVRDCSCDTNIVAFVFAVVVAASSLASDVGVTSNGLDDVRRFGCGGGDFLLRNRELHRVVIMAMLVANARNENEKYRNEPFNELLALS
jgi:hypothetical protein